MSSVGVILSVVARIKCLQELLADHELPTEAKQLLQGLEEIQATLGETREKEFGEVEKQIVRLSYEIVDAIVDASFKSKETTFSLRKKDGKSKLKQLQSELNELQKDLDSDPEGGMSSTASESSASSNTKAVQSTNSGGSSMLQFLKSSSEELKYDIKRKFSIKTEKKKKPDPDPINSENQEAEAGAEPQSKVVSNNSSSFYQQLKEDLFDPSSKFSVVYIVGDSGMGKTSLTRKLFNDLQLGHPTDPNLDFNVFAWVPINHNFQIKRVLQLLLQKLGPCQEQDIREMNEINLIAGIFAALTNNNNNNLLVLDDIAALDHWESIRLALPFANSTKVIVTTSCKDFLKLPNSFLITGLTPTEILMLLRKEQQVGESAVPNEIEKAIIDITGGSPLFATIIREFFQSEAAATAGHQQQLLLELQSYKSHQGKPQVLGACYKRLSLELIPCLLYLSQFPKDHDIQVDKLYMLLMAENLIIPPPNKKSPQEYFKDSCLNKLACKKLVQVQEDFKTCRLHEQVRSFCNSKGMEEELFKIVDFNKGSETVTPHTRRLTIYLSKYNGDIQFETPEDTPKKILSLLVFDTFESAEEKPEWPSVINDLKEFSRARVVNFDGVDFTVRKVPRGIDKLVLLRYLSFRGCRLEELPASMSNLTLLETLDLAVHGDCKKMLIPNNLFAKMTRLMHLYFPKLYAATNGKAKLQLQSLVRLEILDNFDTEACDVKDLSQFKNLKIISVISNGETEDLEKVLTDPEKKVMQYLSMDITSFDCYNRDSASALKKLLECKFLHSITIKGRIGELPSGIGNVDRITEMVLDGSLLETHPLMDYFVKFHNLQSLVLSNDAYLGITIVVVATATATATAPLFPNLRSMKLQKLQYLESFIIEQGAMPKLSTLLVESCACLKEMSIPKELHDRLQNADDNGGGVYSIMLLPTKFNIVTP